ncbi:alpha/beta fold hydrolase [Alkalicoccobacillus gibsonii]|uniref:Alpha/beta fold hydrolase n=1 Tax=Alkalicoccobacillus gibsonii TaxID=79881 RepID=A0ABU9VI64_9BACI
MTHSLISLQVRDETLSGAVHLPEQTVSDKLPAIVFVHGFIGSKVGEHRLFVKASRYFAEKGYACFRFDFSGCGESSGDYRNLTLSNQIEELLEIIQYIKNQPMIDSEKMTIVGHSLGGAISAIAASRTSVDQLVLWSAVAEPYQDIVQITGTSAVKAAQRNGYHDYHGFELSHTFFEDLKIHDPLKAISSVNNQVLIVHAEQDEDVSVSHAKSYADHTTTLMTPPIYIKHASHTFASSTWENQLFEETFTWLAKTKILSNP